MFVKMDWIVIKNRLFVMCKLYCGKVDLKENNNGGEDWIEFEVLCCIRSFLYLIISNLLLNFMRGMFYLFFFVVKEIEI